MLLGLAGIVLLVRAAWRHARSVRGWMPAVLGLACWLAVAVAPAWLDEFHCVAASVALPGCDWEYHPAPSEPWKLFQLIVLGGVVQALRVGGPIAALTFAIAWLLRRLRPAAPTTIEANHPHPDQNDPPIRHPLSHE
jgi:hypothetical protein